MLRARGDIERRRRQALADRVPREVSGDEVNIALVVPGRRQEARQP